MQGDERMCGASVPALAVRGLTRTVGMPGNRVEVLRGIDLEVAAGQFVAITGPSGSGKSTLLHLFAGLTSPTSGSIRIGPHDLACLDDDGRALLRRRWIGLVFQDFQLLDLLTAEENVALPLTIAGRSRRDARRAAAGALERVGLGHRRRHLPGELSGGEQQRVAIARALVIDPVLLLADEPTGNLDSANSNQVMALLIELAREGRLTILLVTHDPRQAAIAHRIVVLRDGRIAADGPGEHHATAVAMRAA
jgi:putative ABC transport system ATP-binding protein